jgi:hypothetical protein
MSTPKRKSNIEIRTPLANVELFQEAILGTFSLAQCGEYPVLAAVAALEKKFATKDKLTKLLESSFQTLVPSGICSRGVEWKISSGVVAPQYWCKCRRHCGSSWSFIWLHHLLTRYQLKNSSAKLLYLVKNTQWIPDKDCHKYFIECFDKTRVEVCRSFFRSVFRIGNTTLSTILQRIKTSAWDSEDKISVKGKYSVSASDENVLNLISEIQIGN